MAKPRAKATKKTPKTLQKWPVWLLAAINRRRKNFLARRPHRSFCKTGRRDYKRRLQLPGYWSFTNQVRLLLVRNKWLFLKFTALYSILSFVAIGILSQDNYNVLTSTLHTLGNSFFSGGLGQFSVNIAVFAGVVGGVFNTQLTPTQQVYSGLLVLLAWLTLVWLLRQIMAGHKNVRLRDGLYASGSPIVATFLLVMVVLVQIIPFVIAVTAYVAASSVNVLGSIFFDAMFWLVELLLVTASLYWITGSLMALIVVTLPGMYPWRALRVAGDLVVGRRLRLLYRLGWLVFTLFLLWLVVLLPAILVSNISLLKQIPVVPIVVLILLSASMVWIATYLYLLYRKVVDDDTAPA